MLAIRKSCVLGPSNDGPQVVRDARRGSLSLWYGQERLLRGTLKLGLHVKSCGVQKDRGQILLLLKTSIWGMGCSPLGRMVA